MIQFFHHKLVFGNIKSEVLKKSSFLSICYTFFITSLMYKFTTISNYFQVGNKFK